MKLAITGTTGRVGRALADHFRSKHEVLELDRKGFDLSSPSFRENLEALDFDKLINPAAITSLEVCEDEPALAHQVNTAAPGVMTELCRVAGREMLHFSTDYVLAGETLGLHDEDSRLAPLSVYGRTKLEGEHRVLEQGGCVMRVSWVFGPERAAFPDQVIRRALAGEPLAAVADKTSLPTFTRDLADWVEVLMDGGLPHGVIHACNRGEPVSWHGMAVEVVKVLLEEGKLDTCPTIMEQQLADIGAFRAVRPEHTAMATERLTQLIGTAPRDWREALREHVVENLISR